MYMATLPLFSFPCSLLVSAECRLTPWTVSLIVLGALAMGATLVGAIVVTIDGIIVCYIHMRNEDCCNKIREEMKKGELLLCLIVYIVSPISEGAFYKL